MICITHKRTVPTGPLFCFRIVEIATKIINGRGLRLPWETRAHALESLWLSNKKQMFVDGLKYRQHSFKIKQPAQFMLVTWSLFKKIMIDLFECL